ncbi:MAG: NYN domain-containing protein [Rhodospirillaceae bacterium]|nr:NYN domain-containing protein [Rhodospirillaceae bacterium]
MSISSSPPDTPRGLWRGYLFVRPAFRIRTFEGGNAGGARDEKSRRFFDGQNLFHSAKAAFGYTFPNYDPMALARAVCASKGWQSAGVRFYTGVPDAIDNPFWNHFWTAKGAHMGRQGVHVHTRRLRYRNKQVRLPNGATHSFLDGDEKGIDVRIALDVIRLAHSRDYDVALLFCRDQDLSEVADEIRLIAQEQGRWMKIVSAYPYSPAVRDMRGIEKTDWIRIDRATYDGCIDARDYRPKPKS